MSHVVVVAHVPVMSQMIYVSSDIVSERMVVVLFWSTNALLFVYLVVVLDRETQRTVVYMLAFSLVYSD